MIPQFLVATLSLLFFAVAGVSGLIESIEICPRGILVESGSIPSFALGDIAYHNGNPMVRAHEYGHLVHEDELGVLYLPIAGLTSLVGNTMLALGLMDREGYYGLWTERMADEYGD